MDDIRFNRTKYKKPFKIRIINFMVFLNKNWLKLLLFLIFLFIIIFPDITGNIIGNWWNILVNSFLEKLTY